MTEQTKSMNKHQLRSFGAFLDSALMGGHYEVKELEVTDSYGAAYVSITTGLKDDEGTMAECLCRDTYLFFIGKRGGIFQYEGMKQTYRKPYEVKHL